MTDETRTASHIDPERTAAAAGPTDTRLAEATSTKNTEFECDFLEFLPPMVPGYVVHQRIGHGAMGIVYEATQTMLNRPTALKVLRSTRVEKVVAFARFIAEAQVVAVVRHPNVVELYDFGNEEGTPYIAMELLRGGTLADKLAATPQLPPDEAAALVEQIARGVGAAHSHDIVHRDLKPGNVLFDTNGTPKVADFGLAKRVSSDLTATQAFLGTPAYMAPEQAAGKGKFVGPPADVWALGVILFEMLTGRRPFAGDDSLSLMANVIRDDAPKPSSIVATLPRNLDVIVAKCLAKEPADRYHTANEVAEDLRRHRAGEPILAKPAGPLERMYKWARRKPTLAAAWMLALLVLGLGGFAAAIAVLWHDAVLSRDAEKKAKTDAEASRDHLARLEYARSVYLANMEMEIIELGRARSLLERCQPQLRGWEWNYLHRLTHGEVLRFTAHADEIFAVAVSPDGRIAASGSKDRTVRLWEVHTGRQLHVLTAPKAINAVAFSQNGQTVYGACQNGNVLSWDVATGAEKGTFEAHGDVIGCVLTSPADSRILTASRDKTARLWDDGGKLLVKFEGHTQEIWGVAFNADGTLIATASHDGTAKVWNLDGQCIQTLTGHAGPVLSVAFQPNGLQLATSGDDGSIRIWDAKTWQPIKVFQAHQFGIPFVGYTPDGKRLITASWEQAAVVWDTQSWTKQLALFGHVRAIHRGCITPDGRHLLTPGNDRTVRVWDLENDYARTRLKGHTSGVTGVAFSADSKHVATASLDYTAKLWEADTGREKRTLKGHKYFVTAVDFAPNGQSLVTASWDRTAKIWDTTTGEVRRTLSAHTAPVTSASYSADGRFILTSGWDNKAIIWNAATGTIVRELVGHLQRVPTARFSPDGKKVVTASEDKTARIWDVATGEVLVTFTGHDEVVMTAAFSPDGMRVATGGRDNRAHVWEAATGKPIHVLASHTNWVGTVNFSPDGSRIITGGEDDLTMIWDAVTGYELVKLREAKAIVNGVAFSPDGRRVLIGSRDKFATLLDSVPFAPIRMNLTRE